MLVRICASSIAASLYLTGAAQSWEKAWDLVRDLIRLSAVVLAGGVLAGTLYSSMSFANREVMAELIDCFKSDRNSGIRIMLWS